MVLTLNGEGVFPVSFLEEYRTEVRRELKKNGLHDDEIVVTAGALTPKQAIGDPKRRDFPILKGKEVMIQARFRGSLGQAFTSEPGCYRGSLEEIWGVPLNTAFNRALVVSASNAALRHIELVSGTVHCRDSEPEECGSCIVDYVIQRFGGGRIALIGLQPALLSSIASRLSVRVTDLDPENIGKHREGVMVESADKNPEVIEWADAVLATGTSLANGTVDLLLTDKPTVFYGVTISGAARLMNLERYCPCAH